MTFTFVESVESAAAALSGSRFIDTEFMYKPRPPSGREQIVFDWTFHSRLSQLVSQDGILLICDSLKTAESLSYAQTSFPALRFIAVITNPLPWNGKSADTPTQFDWSNAAGWQRYQMTDRWARIDYALQVGRLIKSPGYLIMPAHDAVWGKKLLDTLVQFSQRYTQRGLPAVVSPYTYHQHSTVPGADIPQEIIDLLNTAFGRDSLFRWKIRLNRTQQFWGKMNLVPFGVCGVIHEHIEPHTLEDDLVLDRVIRESGLAARCLWINDPTLYHQALPVFDRDGVRQVIERTLHYSLNIPGELSSSLDTPLDWIGRIHRLIDRRFVKLNSQTEALIAECNVTIAQRLKQYHASWVDWGAYRYVVRVGDPVVEIWKHNSAALSPTYSGLI